MKGKPHTKLWEWRERAKGEDLPCARCSRTGMMTVDHIVPMFFVDVIGLKQESYDHDWNFQYLCRPCNQLKRASFDMTDPRTLINLRRYVDLAEQIYGV